MNNKKDNKSPEEAIGYEDARNEKGQSKTPTEVSDKNVEGVNKRLNPDKHSMESRG
ncbi:hypothetical protein [Dysgonomonas sp. ZJ279]|uniref:hypothetical protein n=1 Tax=Dysgonomonas sp. ZJ279 TaxID=2709796 RepID=UPI0013E9D7E0|nr:hypothetical protein [Dysgonomonas sp. ZJ279]